jgi:hypothetical protein
VTKRTHQTAYKNCRHTKTVHKKVSQKVDKSKMIKKDTPATLTIKKVRGTCIKKAPSVTRNVSIKATE